MAAVALGMDGSSWVELNELGPAQVYVAPAMVLEVRLMVLPTQTGLLDAILGAMVLTTSI